MQFSNKKCEVKPYFCCPSFLCTRVGSCFTRVVLYCTRVVSCCRASCVVLVLRRVVFCSTRVVSCCTRVVLCCLVLLLVQSSRLYQVKYKKKNQTLLWNKVEKKKQGKLFSVHWRTWKAFSINNISNFFISIHLTATSSYQNSFGNFYYNGFV